MNTSGNANDDDIIAHYVFLPYFRQGMTKYINDDDYAQWDAFGATTDQRTGREIYITVNQVNVGHNIQQTVKFYGPGDVTGIDPRIIIRTDPKNNVGDFEPNYFPLIEFSEPDFPWRFTPAKSLSVSSGGNSYSRLRPWFCLVVLKAGSEEEGIAGEYEDGQINPNQPLPSIKVYNDRDSLPDLDYSWAWAHVQVTTENSSIDEDSLNDILSTDPERVLSRILCPRSLEPNILYNAFLVPAYETGRLTGMGQPIPDDAPLLEPAWALCGTEIELPYYYRWEFRTGSRGDFEYLVRLLETRIIDDKVGTRFIDCSKPGYSQSNDFTLPPVEVEDEESSETNNLLKLGGALVSIYTKPTKWPKRKEPNVDSRRSLVNDDNFQEELTRLLNLPETYKDENLIGGEQDPSKNDSEKWIVPPKYGRWHRARSKVDMGTLINPNTLANPGSCQERDWFNHLNLDPRHRVMAGFGTKVIQNDQESLMASAWDQIGDVLKGNEELRNAQFALEVSYRMYNRHLKQLPLENALMFTSKVFPRILIDDGNGGSAERVTVHHYTKNSPIPIGLLDPAFRRINRPLGPLKNRQKPLDDPSKGHLLTRINQGDLFPSGKPEAPDKTMNIGDVSEKMAKRQAGWAAGWLRHIFKNFSLILIGFIVIFFLLLLFFIYITVFDDQVAGLSLITFLFIVFYLVGKIIIPRSYYVSVAENVKEKNITADIIENRNISPRFSLTFPPKINGNTADLAALDPAIFKEFAVQIHEKVLDKGLQRPVIPKAINLANVQSTVIEALNPRKTILSQTKRRFFMNDLVNDNLDRIMAAPEFPQPMYEPLRDISNELLVPGIEHIPQNTIGLVKTNRPFIETYMVGLNHEMARELLWREYPTDQRGSYFRQFWDVAEFFVTTKVREAIEANIPGFSNLSIEEQEIEFNKKLSEQLKDIKPIHHWKKSVIGNNEVVQVWKNEDEQDEENLVLLIRGDLLKKYPNTVIYASQGEWTTKEGKRVRYPTLDYSESKTKYPIFKGTLPPDITFLGFDLTVKDAKGSPKESDGKPGWFFVIEERIGETRFGADTVPDNDSSSTTSSSASTGPVLNSWNELSWKHFIDQGLPISGYIDNVNPGTSRGTGEPQWDTDSARKAWITLQKPVRIAIHADDMMKDVEPVVYPCLN
ncbi:MAG: hypothetical protein ACFFD4_18755 [Candidatus Odinarchaeota archaeon]